MKLPQDGELWVVKACPDHDNVAGRYIWNSKLHDPIAAHSIIRIRCGCIYQETEAEAAARIEVELATVCGGS